MFQYNLWAQYLKLSHVSINVTLEPSRGFSFKTSKQYGSKQQMNKNIMTRSLIIPLIKIIAKCKQSTK